MDLSGVYHVKTSNNQAVAKLKFIIFRMIQRQHCLISKQIAVCSICGFVPGLVWCVTLGYQLPKSYEGISTEPESVPVAIANNQQQFCFMLVKMILKMALN